MIRTYAGPVVVTLAYLTLYYGFILLVLRTKRRLAAEYAARGEKFDRYHGQDREMLAADRVQLNQLEHMGPFLVLLWLVALFVSPAVATGLGAVYVISRAAYPVVLGTKVGRGTPSLVMVSTVPGYLVLIGLTGALLWKLATTST